MTTKIKFFEKVRLIHDKGKSVHYLPHIEYDFTQEMLDQVDEKGIQYKAIQELENKAITQKSLENKENAESEE